MYNPKETSCITWTFCTLLQFTVRYAYLNKHYAMKAYGGVVVYAHIYMTSALVGGE
jgi:hypothetical protein